MTGLILAGGASKRFGTPKHKLMLGGTTLLERAARRMRGLTDRVVIVAGADDVVLPGVPVINDIFSGFGPLGAIHAGLSFTEDTCAVVGCDMPFFSVELLRFLESECMRSLCAVPKAGGFWEPLHAVYRPECISAVERLLRQYNAPARAQGERTAGPQVSWLFDQVTVVEVDEDRIRRFGDPSVIFFNINSRDDYQVALALEERQEICSN